MKSTPDAMESSRDAAESSPDRSAATYSIGELAARFGLATHVLRHWESAGLLTPATRVSGRRRYSQSHIARVALILHSKQVGMGLARTRDLLDAWTALIAAASSGHISTNSTTSSAESRHQRN